MASHEPANDSTEGDQPAGGRSTREVPGWEPVSDDEWAAFDEIGKAGTWEVAGEQVKLTNLDKVIFPGADGSEPLTKRDFVRYHATVAPHILPYLFDRPLNIQRFPDGVEADGFWQKAVPKGTPEWVTRWYREAADEDEARWYVVADSVPTMVWLANQGAVELHPWTSSCDAPTTPSWALIDIDPGTASTFEDVVVLARLYRTALEHLGVAGAPKVTGKRGIQIWVPVRPPITFAETSDWVETVSRTVGATVPDLVSWEWRTADRKGLTRLDYTQNAGNKTLVAPFSARPAPGAPVSVPITWDEIDDPDLAPDSWNIQTVPRRLDEAGDPMRDLIGLDQSLPEV